MGSETRKRTVRITIRMTPEEKVYLDLLSKQTYLTVPELLRCSILNQTIESKIEHSVYEALLHLKAELGRVGELLKPNRWAVRQNLFNYFIIFTQNVLANIFAICLVCFSLKSLLFK